MQDLLANESQDTVNKQLSGIIVMMLEGTTAASDPRFKDDDTEGRPGI